MGFVQLVICCQQSVMISLIVIEPLLVNPSRAVHFFIMISWDINTFMLLGLNYQVHLTLHR